MPDFILHQCAGKHTGVVASPKALRAYTRPWFPEGPRESPKCKGLNSHVRAESRSLQEFHKNVTRKDACLRISVRWQAHWGCCEPEGPKGLRASLGSRGPEGKSIWINFHVRTESRSHKKRISGRCLPAYTIYFLSGLQQSGSSDLNSADSEVIFF